MIPKDGYTGTVPAVTYCMVTSIWLTTEDRRLCEDGVFGLTIPEGTDTLTVTVVERETEA